MPLILAIEPDRRQAAQLAGVVRKRVGAELILVETTERALDAIGNRMPDLVLVPALLSPQDDAALAAALRVIAAAAHVQMLTIPVLGSARPTSRAGGMLSSLRRGKSRAAEPEGCDPTVFADQIASYLEAAAQERPSYVAVIDNVPPVAGATATRNADVGATETAAQTFDAIRQDFTDAVTPSPSLALEVEASVVTEEIEASAATEFVPDEAPAPAIADDGVSFALEEAVRALFADAAPAPEPVIDEPVIAESIIEEFVIDQPERPAAPSYEPQAVPYSEMPLAMAEEPAAEPDSPMLDVLHTSLPALEVHATELEVEAPFLEADPLFVDVAEPPQLVQPVEELVEAPALEVEAEPAIVASEPEPVDEWAAVDALMAALQAMPLAAIEVTAADEWIAPVPQLRKADERSSDAPAAGKDKPAAVPGAKSEREWVALIESLRSDVERLRTERAEKPAAPRKDPPPAVRVAARPVKAAKPIQDEWGFFDPQQCGFAALLAKLDEVTDSEDSSVQVVNQ